MKTYLDNWAFSSAITGSDDVTHTSGAPPLGGSQLPREPDLVRFHSEPNFPIPGFCQDGKVSQHHSSTSRPYPCVGKGSSSGAGNLGRFGPLSSPGGRSQATVPVGIQQSLNTP